MPQITEPLVCPRCGNTSHQDGITHAWLEWVTAPVVGVHDNKIAVRWADFEGGDLTEEDKAQVENVPNVKPDLEHFHCDRCNFNWFDQRETTDSWLIDKK